MIEGLDLSFATHLCRMVAHANLSDAAIGGTMLREIGMAMRSVSLVVGVLMLAACGQSASKVDYHADGGQTVTISDGLDRTVKAEIGASAKMPGDLPSWTPAYPGSTIVVSQQQHRPDGRLESVMLQTRDDLARVTAFYDQQIVRAGLKPVQDITSAETSVRMIETPTGMISIGVTKSDDGGSIVSITRVPV